MNQNTISDMATSAEIREKINVVIQSLSDKLGVSTDHLNQVLVQQTYAEGLNSVIMGCAGILGILVILVLGIFLSKFYADRDKLEARELVIAVTIVLIFFLGCGIVPNTSIGMLKMMNPEYYAIQNILQIVK